MCLTFSPFIGCLYVIAVALLETLLRTNEAPSTQLMTTHFVCLFVKILHIVVALAGDV